MAKGKASNKSNPAPETNAPSQLARFKATAKALECNEDKGSFEDKLAKIAKQKATKSKKS